MACVVCGLTAEQTRCKACHEVRNFVTRLTATERQDYVLVVDGSYTNYPKPKGHGAAGAGLVLAREADETVIAYCAVSYLATSSDDAEFEAIRRGELWAPLGTVWTDSNEGIRTAWDVGINARYINQHLRDPLHNLAHRLANIARLQQWDKLERVWVPGVVWP